MNLHELLTASANAFSDKTAVIDGERQMTYAELLQAVEAARDELASLGLLRAQRVGLLADNGVDYIIASYAILAAGGAISPISTDLSQGEQRAIIDKVDLNALIHTTGAKTPVSNGPDSSALSCGMMFRWLDQGAAAPDGFAELNPAFLRFTSGTTGDSKGVVLSHETIADRTEAANRTLRIGPDDTVLWVLSMAYHFTVSIVSYIANGATIVLARTFPPSAILRAARQHRATVLYASPTQFRMMAASRDGEPLGDARLAIATTAALPASVAEAFRDRFGLPLSECYGIIEGGLPFINLDAPWEKRGSVGRVAPGYEARLVADGAKVLTGEVGEICLRGQGFLDAYYSPWRVRDDIFRDGWFHTGDLGCFDAAGFLRIVGRAKEIINVGGMKVFPSEVEAAIDAHPDVVESRVSGQPHPQLGEIPCAMVVTRDGVSLGEDDVLRHCRDRLAAYETPVRVEFVDAVPRTASGKIQRW